MSIEKAADEHADRVHAIGKRSGRRAVMAEFHRKIDPAFTEFRPAYVNSVRTGRY